MDIELLHVGMKVHIDGRSSQTKREHGFVDQMIPMLGTVQIIQSVSIYYNEVQISGYNWSSEDLSLYNWSPEDVSLSHKTKKVIDTKKVTPVLFNPKELVL